MQEHDRPNILEDIRLSPTERLVVEQLLQRIGNLGQVTDYLENFRRVWGSKLPDGDH
jgi:hypothetical protein